MLELKAYDGDTEVVLQFEHSLLSLSKWESKSKTPFLATPVKTAEVLLDYFEDMLLTPGTPPGIIYRLSPEQLKELTEYINDPMSASSVPQEGPNRRTPEITTSELIYYWMTALKIPFNPAETWHLNRLMMLIQIANYKNQPEKKRRPGQVLNDWREQNARLKKDYGTNG